MNDSTDGDWIDTSEEAAAMKRDFESRRAALQTTRDRAIEVPDGLYILNYDPNDTPLEQDVLHRSGGEWFEVVHRAPFRTFIPNVDDTFTPLTIAHSLIRETDNTGNDAATIVPSTRMKYREPWYMDWQHDDERMVITDGVESFPLMDASQNEIRIALAGTIERVARSSGVADTSLESQILTNARRWFDDNRDNMTSDVAQVLSDVFWPSGQKVTAGIEPIKFPPVPYAEGVADTVKEEAEQ